ncbi:MAG: phosphohydrolase [Desulfotalea sp.]|nr:MAG: phosphohydrolase [Desulfotalea sp.]
MKCPGQDMQYWKDDAIFEVNCPECDSIVEFYKDDTSRKCGKCEHRFVNPKLDFGCASYCQFAEQCLGTLPEDFLGNREDLLKDKVAVLLKRHLKIDFKKIREATELAQIGETICKGEGGNLAVVLCAAYLHRVDEHVRSQILNDAGANETLTGTIFQTIQQQASPASSPLEAQILADAITLSKQKTYLKQQSESEPNTVEICSEDLLTQTGRAMLTDL